MSSLLEQARARAAARRSRQVTIGLDELAIELLCDVPTDLAAVEKMQAAARGIDKKAPAAHFARALVAAQTVEIRIAGETVTIDGQPVAFRDPELQRDFGADAKGCVQELLGADGDILTVANRLMTEAGFAGDDDPT